jgi:hypothetical protein
LTLPPMPWRLLVFCSVSGVAGGVVLGFVRGLRYLPTLPFALVEGGILIGAPATVAGLVVVAGWGLAERLGRRRRT